MNAIEPVADIATGALVAHAVEPATGVDESGHTTERACLNCGATLVGDYCHACGQKGHVHRSLRAFGHDLLHGVFHFEGKIWRTLPLLAWRPGDLTRRYIAGERANFVSPIALFLFGVFLMFASLGSVTFRGLVDDQALSNQRELVVKLEREREALVRNGQPTERIDQRLTEERQGLSILKGIGGRPRGDEPDPVIAGDINTAIPWLDQAWRDAKQNPELLLFKLKTNAYKYSWMLIPLSLPFMWLLFPFSRRFGFYDHTIFVTYSLSFMTFLAIIAAWLSRIGVTGLEWMMIIPPIHFYRQLRGAYSLRRRSALWRAMLLSLFTAFTSTMFLMVLITIGALD